MSIARVNTDYLTGAADAIRRKIGSQNPIPLTQFENEIDNIPTATLTTKTITENGVYNASSDYADGYSSVEVNVPEKDPNEQLVKLFTNTIEYIKIDEPINTFPKGLDSGGSQYIYSNLKFASAKNTNNKKYLEIQTFFNCPKLKYVNIGKLSLLLNLSLGYSKQMKTLVILSPTQIAMHNSDAIKETAIASGTGYVWVFDSLKSDYQNATNWSVYASQIKGFSEAPIFDSSVTYSIGDVCQYNGRFYGYCKRDLTSSTGNPPTGTTADNDYWEYVADIEVI